MTYDAWYKKRRNTYDRYELKIPNEEIKQIYINEIQNHLLPNIEKMTLIKRSCIWNPNNNNYFLPSMKKRRSLNGTLFFVIFFIYSYKGDWQMNNRKGDMKK